MIMFCYIGEVITETLLHINCCIGDSTISLKLCVI